MFLFYTEHDKSSGTDNKTAFGRHDIQTYINKIRKENGVKKWIFFKC